MDDLEGFLLINSSWIHICAFVWYSDFIYNKFFFQQLPFHYIPLLFLTFPMFIGGILMHISNGIIVYILGVISLILSFFLLPNEPFIVSKFSFHKYVQALLISIVFSFCCAPQLMRTLHKYDRHKHLVFGIIMWYAILAGWEFENFCLFFSSFRFIFNLFFLLLQIFFFFISFKVTKNQMTLLFKKISQIEEHDLYWKKLQLKIFSLDFLKHFLLFAFPIIAITWISSIIYWKGNSVFCPYYSSFFFLIVSVLYNFLDFKIIYTIILSFVIIFWVVGFSFKFNIILPSLIIPGISMCTVALGILVDIKLIEHFGLKYSMEILGIFGILTTILWLIPYLLFIVYSKTSCNYIKNMFLEYIPFAIAIVCLVCIWIFFWNKEGNVLVIKKKLNQEEQFNILSINEGKN